MDEDEVVAFIYDYAEDVSHHFMIPLWQQPNYRLFIEHNKITCAKVDEPGTNVFSYLIDYMLLRRPQQDVLYKDFYRTIEFYATDKLVCTLNIAPRNLEKLAKQMCTTFLQRGWYRRSMHKQFCKIIEQEHGDIFGEQEMVFRELFLRREVWDEHRLAMYQDYYVEAIKKDKYLHKNNKLAIQVWTNVSELWSGFTEDFINPSSPRDQNILLLNLCLLNREKRTRLIPLFEQFDLPGYEINQLCWDLQSNNFFTHDFEVYGHTQKVAIVARIVCVITHWCKSNEFVDNVVRTHAKNLLVAALKDAYNYRRVPWNDFALLKNGHDYEWKQENIQSTFARFVVPDDLNYSVFHKIKRIQPTSFAHQLTSYALAINTITRLLRMCTRRVETDTVVYRLTNKNNSAKAGLRSVSVIPSNVIIPGWTGKVYKLLLKQGVNVITAPLLHDAYGYHEFEMIVVDGVIDSKETQLAGGNTLVVRNKTDFEVPDQEHGTKKKRFNSLPQIKPLYLKLRLA